MSQDLQDLLKHVTERPPRSKLEPYCGLIKELRLKRWPYRDIAALFEESSGWKSRRARSTTSSRFAPSVLAEWLTEQKTPCTLLDLDMENKQKGSFQHFLPAAKKLNVNTPAGLDSFVDLLDGSAPVLMADMGAGAGRLTHAWFDEMHESVAELGVAFTAIGIITDDPASVDSVLSWGAALQNRVEYLVVENAMTAFAEFTYWRESEQAMRFREVFQPTVISMAYRIPDLETACRNHGVTLGQVSGRKTDAAELQRNSLVLRAQSYRSQLFAEIEKAKDLLHA